MTKQMWINNWEISCLEGQDKQAKISHEISKERNFNDSTMRKKTFDKFSKKELKQLDGI